MNMEFGPNLILIHAPLYQAPEPQQTFFGKIPGKFGPPGGGVPITPYPRRSGSNGASVATLP